MNSAGISTSYSRHGSLASREGRGERGRAGDGRGRGERGRAGEGRGRGERGRAGEGRGRGRIDDEDFEFVKTLMTILTNLSCDQLTIKVRTVCMQALMVQCHVVACMSCMGEYTRMKVI